MYKRGQLTLFIILGIMVVVVVSSYILFFSDYSPLSYFNKDLKNPNDYISECVTFAAEDVLSSYLDNNFFFEEVENNYFRYNNDGVNENVPYLCTVGEFYKPCINQDPNLQGRLVNDLTAQLEVGIKSCFSKLKRDLEKKGYSVELIEGEIRVIPRLKDFQISIGNIVNLVDNEDIKSFSNFEVSINSNIFNLAKLATTIANFESSLCAFDLTTWVRTNSEIMITRFRGGEQTKLYTLRHRNSNEEIKFAIKTCLLPAGI
jgi:hypothetical protein